jgi:hypothetical protein
LVLKQALGEREDCSMCEDDDAFGRFHADLRDTALVEAGLGLLFWHVLSLALWTCVISSLEIMQRLKFSRYCGIVVQIARLFGTRCSLRFGRHLRHRFY